MPAPTTSASSAASTSFAALISAPSWHSWPPSSLPPGLASLSDPIRACKTVAVERAAYFPEQHCCLKVGHISRLAGSYQLMRLLCSLSVFKQSIVLNFLSSHSSSVCSLSPPPPYPPPDCQTLHLSQESFPAFASVFAFWKLCVAQPSLSLLILIPRDFLSHPLGLLPHLQGYYWPSDRLSPL